MIKKRTRDFFMLAYSSVEKSWRNFIKNFSTEEVELLLSESKLSWPPQTVLLDIGTSCNLDCPFCYNHSGAKISIFDKKKNSKEELLSFIKENAPFENLAFSGAGEPFLYPESLEILEEAQNFCNSFSLSTNVQTLDEEKIERLSKLNINSIVVSSDAADKENYQIFRKNGNYDRFLKNISLMYEAFGSRLSIMSVVFKQNADSLLKFPKLLSDLGLEKIPLLLVKGVAHPDLDKKSLEKMSDDEMISFMLKFNNKVKQYGGLMQFSGSSFPEAKLPKDLALHEHIYTSTCMQPFNHYQININGEVNYCCGGFQTIPKNAFLGTPKEHWNDSEVLKLRIMMAAGYNMEGCKKLCKKEFNFTTLNYEEIKTRLSLIKQNIPIEDSIKIENITKYLEIKDYLQSYNIAIYGAGEFTRNLLKEKVIEKLKPLVCFDDFNDTQIDDILVQKFKKEIIKDLNINKILIISNNYEDEIEKNIRESYSCDELEIIKLISISSKFKKSI